MSNSVSCAVAAAELFEDSMSCVVDEVRLGTEVMYVFGPEYLFTPHGIIFVLL